MMNKNSIIYKIYDYMNNKLYSYINIKSLKNRENEKNRIRKLLQETKNRNTSVSYNNYVTLNDRKTTIPKILENKKMKLLNIKQPDNYTFIGIKKKYIIVKEELEFYLKLKKITDKYGFSIFPFMRVADIIKTKDNSPEFNKVCSRHIDFTIVDKYTKPLLYIELDGASHNNEEQKIRDAKKDYIFKTIDEIVYRIKLYEMNYKLIEINEYLRYIYVNNYLK